VLASATIASLRQRRALSAMELTNLSSADALREPSQAQLAGGDIESSTAYMRSGPGDMGSTALRPAQASHSGYRAQPVLLLLGVAAAATWVAALVLLANTPSNPSCAQTPSPGCVYTVDQSPNDRRQYRVVVLDNMLEVLLISDPATKVSSAAMDVKVCPACEHVVHVFGVVAAG